MSIKTQIFGVVLYLLIFLGGVVFLGAQNLKGQLPSWLEQFSVVYNCVLAGGVGGCVYCLRGVYLNACVRKSWDGAWMPWYFIRPIVSLACGGISYFFLKAGLLILESEKRTDGTDFGFYALALIAGLNVDKFLSKIEDIAQAAWGIEKSRASKEFNESKANEH